jgi:hypothetical protein
LHTRCHFNLALTSYVSGMAFHIMELMLSWRGKFAAQPHGPRNRRVVVVPAQLRQILTRGNAKLSRQGLEQYRNDVGEQYYPQQRIAVDGLRPMWPADPWSNGRRASEAQQVARAAPRAEHCGNSAKQHNGED